jgi:hypothetical protein
MWGFILFVVSTVVMIFGGVESGIWPMLWHIGALSVCVGGYWFWFFIRCDVNSEGHPWYKLVRADLFIVSLLMTTTFALLWSIIGGILLFAIFILASTVLFTTVCGLNSRTCSSNRLRLTRRRSPNWTVLRRTCLTSVN